MPLTAKQQKMTATWNTDALFSFPAIQWNLMQMQAKARTMGMNVTDPRKMKRTLHAMKAAFGLSAKCNWSTFVAHMDLFMACSDVVSRITGELAPERMQWRGGLPSAVRHEVRVIDSE